MTDETPTTPNPQDQPQDQNPQVSPPQAQTPPRQDPLQQSPLQQRPQPEYGEYAPEGWVSPVSQSPANEPSGTTPPSQVPGGAQAPAPSYAPPSSAPHNLGLGSSHEAPTPQAPAYQPPVSTPQHGTPPQHAEPVSGKGAPTSWEGGSADTPVAQPPAAPVPPAAPQYQSPQYGQQAPAAPQYQATQQFQQQPQQPGFPPAPKQGSRVADRVITIILLVIGAFGALQMALSIMTLGTQFEMLASMVGAENVTIPASMGTLETVGTLTLLAIYAVTLIWSIQRLRARKLTFWVPLVAGVLAFVATLVFVSIGLSMVPDLMNSMTPENLDRMLQELSTVPTAP